jgi:hypothetical protein
MIMMPRQICCLEWELKEKLQDMSLTRDLLLRALGG